MRMWGTWSASSLREDWRSSNFPSILGNNSGLTQDGSKSTTRQAEVYTRRTGQLARKEKGHKRQILSLVGSLHHATKVVYYGRTFISRMYVTAAKVKELDYFTRLNMNFCSDLLWWYTFITTWDGHSLFRWHTLQHSATIIIQTDASGTLGCGAVFGFSGSGP